MDESPAQPDFDRLAAQLAAGGEAAFARLYETLGARMYRTALGILGRPQDAEDAVQETFVALVRSRRQLGEARDLAAYVFTALRHVAIRHAQRRPRESTISLSTLACEAAAREPADDPRQEALRDAVLALPAAQREVVILKIDGELTLAQIAQVLAISPHTAASRYRYALERLRERLKDC